jgi:hypothetical protein
MEAMGPNNPLMPKPVTVENPLEVMQPGEKVLFEIKRHPLGIAGIFVGNGLFILLLAVVAFIVVPLNTSNTSRSAAITISAVLFVLVALLSIGFMYVTNMVYWGNRWIVTSDSITQCRQTSLLDHDAKQLSLSSIEDVSASQHGVFAKMYNYGTLKAETTKERNEFMLTFCPEPMKLKRVVAGLVEESLDIHAVVLKGLQLIHHRLADVRHLRRLYLGADGTL